MRALEVVGQFHVHVEVRDRMLFAFGLVLDPHRVADVLYADLIDWQTAGIGTALHVRDGDRLGFFFEFHFRCR